MNSDCVHKMSMNGSTCIIIEVDLQPGKCIDISKIAPGLGIGKCWIEVGGVFYKYRVKFNCHSSLVSYVRFTCGEPDTYSCGVALCGNHYIDYNSPRPAMNKVTIEYKQDMMDVFNAAVKVVETGVKVAAVL